MTGTDRVLVDRGARGSLITGESDLGIQSRVESKRVMVGPIG